MDSFETIVYEQKGNVGVIALNRPRVRNAMNTVMIRELSTLFAELDRNDDIKVIILRSTDTRAFCSGFDIKESSTLLKPDVIQRREKTNDEIALFLQIWNLQKPVIAEVTGYCIGGGLLLALICDMIVASENALFGAQEILMGYINYMPVDMWKMPFNKAREFAFVGDFKTAKEMDDLGVVNHVETQEELEAKTLELANKIARVPINSIKLMKAGLAKCYELRGFNSGIDYMKEMFNLCRLDMMQNSDIAEKIAKEGVKGVTSKIYDK